MAGDVPVMGPRWDWAVREHGAFATPGQVALAGVGYLVTEDGHRYRWSRQSGHWELVGREPFAAAFYGCWCD